MAECVCEWDRSDIGETGRPLAMCLHEYRLNFKEGLLEKSKLAKHVYKEGHEMIWDEARIWGIKSNGRYGNTNTSHNRPVWHA
jgi:hypothetical protein